MCCVKTLHSGVPWKLLFYDTNEAMGKNRVRFSTQCKGNRNKSKSGPSKKTQDKSNQLIIMNHALLICLNKKNHQTSWEVRMHTRANVSFKAEGLSQLRSVTLPLIWLGSLRQHAEHEHHKTRTTITKPHTTKQMKGSYQTWCCIIYIISLNPHQF